MPQTQKEYDKRYYEKLRADPVRYKAYLEKQRENTLKKKEDPVKYEKHLQKRRVYDKEYRKTENSKKPQMISSWKYRGIIDTDFDLLYDYYILQNNCMVCGIEFKNSLNRHLDHDHNTGEVRYICCCKCNTSFLASKYE